MGEFTSSSTFYGRLWSETFADSGIYEGESFVPTVYTFDINPDTLELKNVEILEIGMELPNSGRSNQSHRRYYLGENYDDKVIWWDTHTGLGIYTFYSPSYKLNGDNSWFEFRNYGFWDSDYYTNSKGILIGGFYHAETKNSYLLVSAYRDTDSVWETWAFRNVKNTTGYATWSEPFVESMSTYILSMFYGDSPSSRKIVRISPKFNVFKRGESQILEYALVDVIGNVLSNSPSEFSVYTGTGWGYSEGTKTLTYKQGNWTTSVSIKFIYEEQEYSLNNIFYPEGRGLYDPGNSEYGGGIGPGGSGGTGNFGQNEISDSVIPPSGSVEGDASSTGMYTRYLVNSSYLDIFGDWLWTTDLGLAIAKSAISVLYGDPAESVISLLSFPFQFANTGAMSGIVTKVQNLYWGNHNSLLPFYAIHSNAVSIDWGSIELYEYWGNFLDYTPHTKIDLYLPWGTGFVSIDPGQCLPGTLKVITNVELSKGSCIHNVIGNNGVVIGSFAGQCGKQMPLFSSDFASKMAGLVTAAAAGIVVGASAGVGIAAGANYGSKIGITTSSGNFIPKDGAVIDMASEQMMSNISQTGRVAGKIATTSLAINKTPVHVSRNGGFTDGSASLGVQYPYIILSRPTQSVPEEYGHHYGYPSNISAKLNTLKGYTEIGEIHLDGISATDSELKELDAILKGGVIF